MVIYIDTHYIHHYTHMCVYIYTYAAIIYICIYIYISHCFPIISPNKLAKIPRKAWSLRPPCPRQLGPLVSEEEEVLEISSSGARWVPPKKAACCGFLPAPPWMVERAINNGKHLAVNWCGFSSVHSMSPLAVAYNYMVTDH